MNSLSLLFPRNSSLVILRIIWPLSSDLLLDHSLPDTWQGTQHSILYRTYGRGIGDDLHPFYFFCHGRDLSLTQLHTLHHSQELLLWLIHFELLQKLVKVCALWKSYEASQSISIDFWCLTCKQPLPRSLSLTPLHTMQELVSLTDLFWTFSKSHQGVWKSLSGVFDLSL